MRPRKRVATVMTGAATVIPVTAGLGRVRELFAAQGIHAAPVTDHLGRVVGIITDRELDTQDAGGPAPPTAGDVRVATVATIRETASISEAARLMLEHGLAQLAVVDRKGRGRGVLSKDDALRALLPCDQAILREVRDDLISDALWCDPTAVTVEVRSGVVQVRGSVARRSQVELLERLIPQLDGVAGLEADLSYVCDDVGLRPEPEQAGEWPQRTVAPPLTRSTEGAAAPAGRPRR